MPNIRVMHFGLGPIGAAIVKQVASRPGFKIVGAIDIDAAKVGRDLGDVVGLSKRLGAKVSADAAKALKAAKPDVVVLCTSSSIKTVLPQIETILKAKVPIVSTTEELSYPGYTHIRQARLIHAMAKKAKVAVLGTGVNPGFAMDALPIALSAVCERVDRVVVQRVQDARIRRLPFQQKIGAGLTTEQFQKKVDDGSVRHVGLTESIAMIADAMGWTLDRITDEIQPKLATVTISSEYLAVDPGYVAGIIQDGIGYRKNEPVIKLHMEAYLGSPETFDSVDIEGSPQPVDEDCRRHPRRRRDGIDCGQLDPEGAAGLARAAHDARSAAAFLFPRHARVPAPGHRLRQQSAPSRLIVPLDDLVEYHRLTMPKRGNTPIRGEMLQGTLDLLILKTLAIGPAHGHTIAYAIERQSEDVLAVEHGSLYPALHRIEDRGWISSFWGTSENNRRARYYRLTPEGRKQLTEQTNRWDEIVRAVNRILRPA